MSASPVSAQRFKGHILKGTGRYRSHGNKRGGTHRAGGPGAWNLHMGTAPPHPDLVPPCLLKRQGGYGEQKGVLGMRSQSLISSLELAS